MESKKLPFFPTEALPVDETLNTLTTELQVCSSPGFENHVKDTIPVSCSGIILYDSVV